MKTLRRTLHPEIKVLDAKKGLVEYVASDETLDCYREVVKASGWLFDHFEKNAPFIDSHDTYTGIEKLLGQVVSFEVARKKLIEVVQWAKDVPGNTLAALGFAMTEAGFLKAVSVGFWPVKAVSYWDSPKTDYLKELARLGFEEDDPQGPRTIYLEQQQIELSAVIIGANPNALARAYKAGALDDAGIDLISQRVVERQSRDLAPTDAQAKSQRARHRRRFLDQLQHSINKL